MQLGKQSRKVFGSVFLLIPMKVCRGHDQSSWGKALSPAPK